MVMCVGGGGVGASVTEVFEVDHYRSRPEQNIPHIHSTAGL